MQDCQIIDESQTLTGFLYEFHGNADEYFYSIMLKMFMNKCDNFI